MHDAHPSTSAPCPKEVRCPNRRYCPLACQEAGSREDPAHRPSNYVQPAAHLISTETLRRAAAGMREPRPLTQESVTLRAVAELLEWEADEAERFQAQTRAPRQMVNPRLLAVARAYLGESA